MCSAPSTCTRKYRPTVSSTRQNDRRARAGSRLPAGGDGLTTGGGEQGTYHGEGAARRSTVSRREERPRHSLAPLATPVASQGASRRPEACSAVGWRWRLRSAAISRG